MKRSEAIDKIQLLLETQSHYGTSYRFKALELLELIEEEVGMRPPYDASQDDEVDIMEWEQE